MLVPIFAFQADSIQNEGGYCPRKDETGLRRWMGLPVSEPAASASASP